MSELLYQIEQAFLSLRDNKLRSLLSVLGIAIGVAAVLLIAAVSEAGRMMVFAELDTFGLRSIWVQRDYNDKDPNRQVSPGTRIDSDDFLAIDVACCPDVQEATPILRDGRKSLVSVRSRYSNGPVLGVGAQYLRINNDSLREGRNFRAADIRGGRAFVIIGSVVAADLFQESRRVVGQELKIGGSVYTVIGVLNDKSRDFLASIGSSNGDPNNRILVPYTALQRETGSREINQIQASAVALDRAADAAAQLVGHLERRHRLRFSYRSETMAQYVSTANRILRGVTLVGVVAAAISLLVGGMGIMNMMGTSVLERTREIGLRKALGARRADVRHQFLIEAAAISVTGGAIGIAAGVGIIGAANLVSPYPVAPSLAAAGAALAISLAIGILSGYLPAQRAARLHPVVALRYE